MLRFFKEGIMVMASDLKKGMIVVFNGKKSKVLSSEKQMGGGKAGSMEFVTFMDVDTGHIHNFRFSPTDKLEEVPTTRKKMEYLYGDDDYFYFMDEISYEQVPISKKLIGDDFVFLKENKVYDVEFAGEDPIGLKIEPYLELQVVSTPKGLKDTEGSTWKEATLENGLKIMVPQFIEAGDFIRIDTEKKQYVERVKKEKK